MLLHRIMGAETEFSVAFPDHPLLSDTQKHERIMQLVNGYGVKHRRNQFGSPHLGPSLNQASPNYGRLYLDMGSHPEYSSPETSTPLQAALYDIAGPWMMARVAEEWNKSGGERVAIFKNNTDGVSSWGWHLNVLGERKIADKTYRRAFMPYLVSAQVVCGSGYLYNQGTRPMYMLSQRPMHLLDLHSSATTRSRPIWNTKDEPECDPELYRRLHIIPLDANMSEVATFLKNGMVWLVAEMAECGCAPGFEIELQNPVQAIRQISLDPTLKCRVELVSESSYSAVELQEIYYEAAKEHLDNHRKAEEAWHRPFLDLYETVLSGLRSDIMSLKGHLDWVAKLWLCETKLGGLTDRKAGPIDLNYHRCWRPGVYHHLVQKNVMKRLFTDEQIQEAAVTAPSGRAYARARLAKQFPGQVGGGWYYLSVVVPGEECTRGVSPTWMMDPFGPTDEFVDSLAGDFDLLLDELGLPRQKPDTLTA